MGTLLRDYDIPKITVVLFAGHHQGFCCSHWEHELTRGRPLSPLMMQAVSMSLSLVSTRALLISHSIHSANLLFFQKATAVIVIVTLTCIKDCEEQREGHMHETN